MSKLIVVPREGGDPVNSSVCDKGNKSADARLRGHDTEIRLDFITLQVAAPVRSPLQVI
jgi:hypothetical protein